MKRFNELRRKTNNKKITTKHFVFNLLKIIWKNLPENSKILLRKKLKPLLEKVFVYLSTNNNTKASKDISNDKLTNLYKSDDNSEDLNLTNYLEIAKILEQLIRRHIL